MSDWSRRAFGLMLMGGALSLPMLRATDRPVEGMVAEYGAPPSDFLDLDGQLVHVRDEGPRSDPVPILMLHGTGSSLHTWEGWARGLRGHRRVIRLDLPGFGLTGPWSGPNAGKPYTAETWLPFLQQVLARQRWSRLDVIGNGIGGELAWRLAVAQPEAVRRLVLVDSAGLAAADGESHTEPLGWQIARVPVFGRLGEHMLTRGFVRQALATAMARPERVTDAMVERHYQIALRDGNREALIQHLRGWSPGDGVRQLPPIGQPTLVLWGAADAIIPAATGQRMAAQIPGARWQPLPDLGHLPQEEDPVRSLKPVQAFVDAPEPG